MGNSPPVTVTSVLQTIFDDVGEPALVKAIAVGLALIPGVGLAFSAAWTWIMNAPIIGSFLQGHLKTLVDNLSAAGVIDVKEGIIKYLDDKAQTKWAPELALLKQYSDEGMTFTPEEQAAYDAALQNVVRNRGGIVNA